MESKLKFGIVGYAEVPDAYGKVFEKIDDRAALIGYFGDVGKVDVPSGLKEFDSYTELLASCDALIFLGEKPRKKMLSDAIRSLKHVFIDDYSMVLNDDVDMYYNLAVEAQAVVQVSIPKIHYWNIEDVKQSFKNICHLQFVKEQSYTSSRFQTDIIPELLATLKIVEGDLLRIHSYSIPLLSKKIEMLEVRLDFSNGVIAQISCNPCGFVDRQELKIVSDKELAVLDLRRREWHSLVYSKSKELQKELINMDEVPFVEQVELEDFISSIETKQVPSVSLSDMKALHRALVLMKESSS